MPIHLVLVDDHARFREALAGVLSRQPDLVVEAQLADPMQALAAAGPLHEAGRLDVLLVDIGLPGLDGIELTRLLLARRPALPVVALTMHDESHVVRAMFAAGARGYVLKDDPLAQLLQALHAVAAGGTWCSPAVAAGLRSGSTPSDSSSALPSGSSSPSAPEAPGSPSPSLRGGGHA